MWSWEIQDPESENTATVNRGEGKVVGSRDGSEEKEGLEKSPKQKEMGYGNVSRVVAIPHATWPQSQSCLPRALLEL